MTARDQGQPGVTLADLARQALAVQDACNLSGVVHGYARALSRLRELLPDASTTAINQHPIAQLWADKCASLAGVQGQLGAKWAVVAYREVARLAGLCVPPGEHPADRERTPAACLGPDALAELDREQREHCQGLTPEQVTAAGLLPPEAGPVGDEVGA